MDFKVVASKTLPLLLYGLGYLTRTLRSFHTKVSRLCYEAKALASNPIMVFRKGIACLPIPLTAFLLSCQLPLECCRFLFLCIPKAWVRNHITIRVGEKLFCPNVHTTSGLRNTGERIRDLANDKAIPAACRLFQRDLFRVSTERTMHPDFDFTKFGDFQSIQACTCRADRILTNTLTRLKFVFPQTPCSRADRTFEFRVSFLSLFRVFTPPKEVVVCRINQPVNFDDWNVHPFEDHARVLKLLIIVYLLYLNIKIFLNSIADQEFGVSNDCLVGITQKLGGAALQQNR